MQIKNYILIAIVSFLVGSAITGGTIFYFFCKANGEYEKEISRRNDFIKSLKSSLESANLTIDDITRVRKKLSDNNIEAVSVVNRIADIQSEIRRILESGSTEK